MVRLGCHQELRYPTVRYSQREVTETDKRQYSQLKPGCHYTCRRNATDGVAVNHYRSECTLSYLGCRNPLTTKL